MIELLAALQRTQADDPLAGPSAKGAFEGGTGCQVASPRIVDSMRVVASCRRLVMSCSSASTSKSLGPSCGRSERMRLSLWRVSPQGRRAAW